MKPDTRHWLFLAACCVAVYAQALFAGFIADDATAVVNNPLIRQNQMLLWHDPAALLTSLNYLIAGDAPFFYHLTNLILHCLNTALVFYFLGAHFGRSAAFFGALLFAAHPVHAEAVTWVSGRPYLIISLFMLANYLLYRKAQDAIAQGLRKGYLLYALCVLVFSYTMLGSFGFYWLFPLLPALSDISFKRWRKSWPLWLPLWAILALKAALFKASLAGRAAFMAETLGAPALNNPAYFVYSLFVHAGLLLWPARLSLFHEGLRIPEWVIGYSWPLSIAILGGWLAVFRISRVLFFAAGILILFLAPTYSPLPLSSLIAERYLYFPSVAMGIVAAWAYEKGLRLPKRRWRGFVAAASAAVLALAAARTIVRNNDWGNPQRFWEETAKVSPLSWQAHSNLGFLYLKGGAFEKAIAEYEAAASLRPGAGDVHNNLAVAYYKAGRIEGAIRALERSLAERPDYAAAHYNLAVLYLEKGDLPAARKHAQEALRLGNQAAEELLGRLK